MSYGRPSNSDNNLAVVRIDTISSIASDATASNLPGPGRTVGLLFDWLGGRFEVFLNRLATRRGLGPTATAQEIRRLRRHHDTSFQLRLATALSSLPQAEMRRLKKLCSKLLKYARSPVLSTQLKASQEILELAFEDPIVRRLLAESRLEYLVPNYTEPDLVLSTSKALGSIRDSYTHRLWSDFILDRRLPLVGEALVIPPGLAKALEDSLSRPTSSFVAARYFQRALKIYDGPVRYSESSQTFVLHDIGRHYLEVAASNSSSIEWSTLDDCVKFLHGILSTDKISRGDSSGCNSLYRLTGSLIREARQVPHTLYNYFMVPELETLLAQAGDFADMDYEFRFEDNVSFYLEGLKTLLGSDNYTDQVVFLHSLDRGTRRLLKGTVFLNDSMVAHCHLESCVSYTSIAGQQFMNGPSERTLDVTLNALTMLVVRLRQELVADDDLPFSSPIERTILIARSIAYSRYHKVALHDAIHSLTPRLQIHFSPKMLSYVYDLATSRRRLHFSRSSSGGTLGRFCVDGQYFVHHLGQQRRKAPSHMKAHEKHGLVDCMVIGANDVVCLDVDGPDEPFDPTGHFPVLVGRSSSGEAYYLAVIETFGDEEGYAFGCVKDGGSTATYKDDLGTHIAQKFKVLALRYDPCDTYPYPRTDECAVDATGPLYWRQYTVDFVILHECGLGKDLFSTLVTGLYDAESDSSDEEDDGSDESSETRTASAETSIDCTDTSPVEGIETEEGEDGSADPEKASETQFYNTLLASRPLADPEGSNGQGTEASEDQGIIHQLSEKLESAEEQIAMLKRKIEELETHN